MAHCNLLIPASLPSITSQPETSLNVVDGEDISLIVTAKGHPPLKYQWTMDGKKLKDNYDFSGSSTHCLLIKQAHVKLMGEFQCTVSNKEGKVLSSPTTLTIGGCGLVK